MGDEFRRFRQGPPRPNGRGGQYRNNWRQRDTNNGPQSEEAQAQRGRFQGRHYNQQGNRPLEQNERQDSRERQHPNNRSQNHQNQTRVMGFRLLETLAQADIEEVIVKINSSKDSFINLLNNINPKDESNHNMFVLIMELLSKVSLSTFVQLKLTLLLKVCDSDFIGLFEMYLMNLPTVTRKTRNKLYWDNQERFWLNFSTFCECVINISPSTATLKLKSLIDSISKFCIAELTERHGLVLSEETKLKISSLRQRLVFREDEEKTKKQRPQYLFGEDEEPPQNFRELSVVPTLEDLLDSRPAFLRPNIVRGKYRDMEHYLDVQFRLLREDCFGPLRDGINQFLADPKRKKFDNIKVYHDVTFFEPYISKTKIGSVIKLDEKTNKRFKRINWTHSKRFIFGSLLLFTKDNCRSFLTATILDRDVKLLNKGMIPISIVDLGVSENLYNNDKYIMIESEIYFEAYIHVLKALQDSTFPQHLAMSKYIVHVDPEPNPPSYLNQDTDFKVELEDSRKTIFKPLCEETWPSEEDLGLNKSQYEAYKLALTHEFAVVQGPPGTGKTFLGVKVAKTLLKNVGPRFGCLLLIICYTNHALDQFLEAILPLTNSIARIGGQSRNEAMEKININKLRLQATRKFPQTNRLYYEQMQNLKCAVNKVQYAQNRLHYLQEGLMSFNSLKDHIPEVRVLGEYYTTHRRHIETDPLRHWLFENMEFVEFQTIIEEENGNQDPADQQVGQNAFVNYEEEEEHERTNFILDEFDYDNDDENSFPVDERIKVSFSVEDTKKKLNDAIIVYKKLDITNIQKQQEMQRQMIELKSSLNLFSEMSTSRNREIRLRIINGMDLAIIPLADRWTLYFRWAAVILNKIRANMQPLQMELKEANTAFEEARIITDLQVLKGIKVVGMTTSGAARLRKLLQTLAPSIVIIEEAAEVLEQHIVTALTEHCKHLILIGDHQQLRPSAAHMRLARHFNIEISLFERMITNGIHSRRLRVQHRMRPEFAELICPHIYTDLENHPSVRHFPSIRGMTDDLFFMTHNFKEEQVDDSSSRTNQKEGDLILGLANYLMQQGYQPEEITILAAYSGQMFYMRKQRGHYLHLSKVKITVLDNYQGEECKIILLSLVRNNNDNKIGFLGTENRVCVALSRAREGMKLHLERNNVVNVTKMFKRDSLFVAMDCVRKLATVIFISDKLKLDHECCLYILGNIDMLKRNSEIWRKIGNTLEENVSVGSQLILKCEIHPTQITTITSAEDFSNKAPEGGCLLKCNFNLPCGHRCPLVCHGYDRGHVNTKCNLKCERVLCDLGHVCPLICSTTCKPCERLVEKTLPCGHRMRIYCHQDPSDPAVRCLTTVTVTLPNCKHETKKPCYLEIGAVKCPVPCKHRVKCGHECRFKCHVTDDPDHEKYVCIKPCAKAKKECTANLDGDRGDHQCQRQCYEECDYCTFEVMKKRKNCKHSQKVPCNFDVDELPCRKNCARILGCGHFCRKKCFENCGDCKQMVTKSIPGCNHTIKIVCMQEATREMCSQPCERTMDCGHPCSDACGRPCNPSKCNVLIPRKFKSPCGHHVKLPCNVFSHIFSGAEQQLVDTVLLKYCAEPCGQLLDCEHLCSGSCGQCRQGRLHVPCTEVCHVTNICGHQCKEPCKQLCPPCSVPCEVKCPHSHCNKLCGEPCFPCQERCERKCLHGACRHRCGEPCSRPPCNVRCTHVLRCGHACRGLCGEPCPDVCQNCRPDQFPKDILGDDLEEDDRLIQLQDCPHVFEVEFLDGLIRTNYDEVKIPACPLCRKPIINTYRYKDRINTMFKEVIDPIKQRVYGTEEKINEEKKALVLKLDEFQITHAKALAEQPSIKNALQTLQKEVKNKKKVSLTNLQMLCLYLNILDMIGEKYQKYKEARLTVLEEELYDLVKSVCQILSENVHKISQQLQKDMLNEIKRMNSTIQLSKILSHALYLASKDNPNVKKAANEAKSTVLIWSVYKEEESLKVLKQLQDAVKVSGIVSKEERAMIVQAIGLKQGHWFKCKNGHFYCIGECGGAMQRGICPECGAAIGGVSHTLDPGNSLTSEMDGSQFPAWSDQYNNMANFNFDF